MMTNFNGVTFVSLNTNISKHSYIDFGVILTEQNIGLPTPKTYTVKTLKAWTEFLIYPNVLEK